MSDISKSIMGYIPSMGNVVASAISEIVYSAITTTGDATASATKTGMDIAGNIIGYGTELIAGPVAGATVRCVANTYSSATKYTIAKSSRIGAIGISFVVYTGAALTTSAVIHGSNIVSHSYNYFQHAPADIPLKEF